MALFFLVFTVLLLCPLQKQKEGKKNPQTVFFKDAKSALFSGDLNVVRKLLDDCVSLKGDRLRSVLELLSFFCPPSPHLGSGVAHLLSVSLDPQVVMSFVSELCGFNLEDTTNALQLISLQPPRISSLSRAVACSQLAIHSTLQPEIFRLAFAACSSVNEPELMVKEKNICFFVCLFICLFVCLFVCLFCCCCCCC